MKTYKAEIDGGEGGEKIIKAADIDAAWTMAVAWAKQGDWPAEGCSVGLRVRNEKNDAEEKWEDVEIPAG